LGSFLESCDLDSDCDYEPPEDVVKKIDEISDGELIVAKQKIKNELKEIAAIAEELGDKEAKQKWEHKKNLKKSALVFKEMAKVPYAWRDKTKGERDEITEKTTRVIERARAKKLINEDQEIKLKASVVQAANDTKGAKGASLRAFSSSIRKGITYASY